MEPSLLIPVPDTLPAQWWLFEALDIAAFIIHIILINIVVGGLLISLFSRMFAGERESEPLHPGAAVPAIPTAMALGINLGVALLLFVQTLYGSLLYTSSIITGTWWISIIPLVILAYYGAHLHVHSAHNSRLGLAVPAAILLWVMFIFVNNMSLMAQPERWTAYFSHRGGTFLNVKDPSLFPRYLHFIIASIAVAGLFAALLGERRRKKSGGDGDTDGGIGLKIFAFATMAQMAAGLLFLVSLPAHIRPLFLGQNILYTGLLAAGILLAAGAILSALKGKAVPAAVHLAALITVMAITRANLRSAYLANYFNAGSMPAAPEYGPMAMFACAAIFVAASVAYMLKMVPGPGRRDAR